MTPSACPGEPSSQELNGPKITQQVIHTETAHEIRVISFRKATDREAGIFFANV